MALIISLVYLATATAWIVFSDAFLLGLTGDPGLLSRLQTYKGIGFVAVTALALFFALNRYVGRILDLLGRVERQRDQLQQVRERWTEAFDAIQDPIMLHDAEQRIVRCNLAYAKKAGLEVKAVIGRPYGECFPRSVRLPVLASPEDRGVPPVEFSTPDGGHHLATPYPVAGPDGTPLYTLHVFRDITERREFESSLAKLNRALKTLGEVNRVLVRARDEAELLEKICRAAVEVGGFTLAWVGYVDDDLRIRPMASHGDRNGYVSGLNITAREDAAGGCVTGIAVREGRVNVIDDTARDAGPRDCLNQARRMGYRSMIALSLKSKGKVFGSFTIYSAEPEAFAEDEIALLEEMASDLAFGITTLRNEVKRGDLEARARRHLEQLNAGMEQAIEAFALTIEKRDPYTAGHQRRVADFAAAIAREMGLPDDRVQGIRLGGLIHDIGKIYIPSEILNRPGKLVQMEFDLIKTHTTVGYDILKGIDFNWPVAQMVLQHHERLDGSGYPEGVKGDAILLEARILAVADVIEAMSSHRPYRPALGPDAGIEEILRHRGTRYDPDVVDAAARLLREKRFDLAPAPFR
ncbi:MAG: GAF domain-containing protein [Betaproteobacteria bacterium]|nr:GAF domain-containing protein [Betaproteobacteria bacterium]